MSEVLKSESGINIITCSVLRNNVERLVKKIEKGFFNIILIFGPTRTGKSTIGEQIGYYMSQKLGTEFTAKNNIFFDASELMNEAKKGVKNAVYQLDEAAFDLKGTDWAKGAQKQLLVLFNTAAMYNQTFIIIIPKLSEMRSHFVNDAHTQGIEVSYSKKTFERGFYKAYTSRQLMQKYILEKNNHKAAEFCSFSFRGRFNKNVDFIDQEEYTRKKIAAIDHIGVEDEKADKNEHKLRALQAKIAYMTECFKDVNQSNLWYYLGNGSLKIDPKTGAKRYTSLGLSHWRKQSFVKHLTKKERERINSLMIKSDNKIMETEDEKITVYNKDKENDEEVEDENK